MSAGKFATAVLQTALAQLGLTEASASSFILTEVDDAGRSERVGKMRNAALAAYRKIPESSRGQVTTALFAWAKTYVGTPAFAAAYQKIRKSRQPARKQYDRTVDEELKRKIDEQRASIENMKTYAASLPPAGREKLAAVIKQSEDALRNPDQAKMMRQIIEAERAAESASEDKVIARWNAEYPPTVEALVASRLRHFLETTSGVDFEGRQAVRNVAGDIVGYVVRHEDQHKPWQWFDALVLGHEATTAARAAAEAWAAGIMTEIR
jgi:hypothetical protein